MGLPFLCPGPRVGRGPTFYVQGALRILRPQPQLIHRSERPDWERQAKKTKGYLPSSFCAQQLKRGCHLEERSRAIAQRLCPEEEAGHKLESLEALTMRRDFIWNRI